MRSLAALVLLACSLVAAPAGAEGPLVVYVGDVSATADAGAVPGALTPSLCAALERRPDLQVVCASDVRQMVEAAAQMSALGRGGNHTQKLEEKVASAHFVVRPFLSRPKGKLKLLLRLHKSGVAAGVMLAPGDPAGRIVEVADDGKLESLLARLDAAAARADKMLHEPRNDPRAPPAPPPTLE